MTADDGDGMNVGNLSEIYRVERKSGTLSDVRPDLYPALAALLKSQKDEYLRLLSDDPDSIMAEGINQRRKRCQDLSKDIIEIRMDKICDMALRGAMGADNPIDRLTKEEREYYQKIMDASIAFSQTVKRLANPKKLKTTRLVPEPEPPVEDEEKWSAEPEEPAHHEEIRLPASEEDMGEEPFPMPDEEFDEDYDGDIPDDELDRIIPSDMPVQRREEPAHAPVSEPEPAGEEDFVLLRITSQMPTISGPDRDYTLGSEDVVLMPRMMADAMLNRKLAVKLSPSDRSFLDGARIPGEFQAIQLHAGDSGDLRYTLASQIWDVIGFGQMGQEDLPPAILVPGVPYGLGGD